MNPTVRQLQPLGSQSIPSGPAGRKLALLTALARLLRT
jgi:hypothetical protein